MVLRHAVVRSDQERKACPVAFLVGIENLLDESNLSSIFIGYL
jgi:hypothetical protein